MIWIFYNVLFAIGFLLLLPKFLLRMARRGGYARDFSQRFGHYRPEVVARLDEHRRVWVHAVSVGEIFVALKLMELWRERRPEVHFVLTTNTSTGHSIAAKNWMRAMCCCTSRWIRRGSSAACWTRWIPWP
jgi:3-deoxy-D-manno-octulosonic-acid transferase